MASFAVCALKTTGGWASYSTLISVPAWVAWWSVAAALHALTTGAWSLGVFRGLLGMGEAGLVGPRRAQRNPGEDALDVADSGEVLAQLPEAPRVDQRGERLVASPQQRLPGERPVERPGPGGVPAPASGRASRRG